MSAQSLNLNHYSRPLTLGVAGLALLLLLIASNFPQQNGWAALSASQIAECDSRADVMGSANQSRNGISLTCNESIRESRANQ